MLLVNDISVSAKQIRQEIIDHNSLNGGDLKKEFETRSKTKLVWNRVFISFDGQYVTFVQLNLFQRVLRYFGCYKKTVIEKEVLEVVLKVIQGNARDNDSRLSQPIPASIEELIKLKKEAESWWPDFIGGDQQENYVIFITNILTQIQQNVNEKYQDDFISGRVVDLIWNSPSVKRTEETWKKLGNIFIQDPSSHPTSAALFRILRAVLEGKKEDSMLRELSCQGIQVPQTLTEIVSREMSIADQTCQLRPTPLEWQDFLHNYRALVEFYNTMINVRNSITKKLIGPEFKQELVKKLRDSLINSGGHPILVDRFLGDESRLADRLFDHSEVAHDEGPFTKKCSQLRQEIEDLEAAMGKKINTEYHSTPNAGGGDCFFHSCSDLMKEEGWRQKTVEALTNNKTQYQALVLRRIKNDDKIPKDVKSYEEYCTWIANQGN